MFLRAMAQRGFGLCDARSGWITSYSSPQTEMPLRNERGGIEKLVGRH